jgi:hypothetical protein
MNRDRRDADKLFRAVENRSERRARCLEGELTDAVDAGCGAARHVGGQLLAVDANEVGLCGREAPSPGGRCETSGRLPGAKSVKEFLAGLMHSVTTRNTPDRDEDGGRRRR